MATKARMLERRQPRQQNPPRLARVARQGQRAFEDVARRQHTELVAELTRAAAAVEHGDDSVDAQPRIALQSAQKARQPGAATEAPDIELPKAHLAVLYKVEPVAFSYQLSAISCQRS